MKLYSTFDEAELKRIARKCDNKQLLKDVSFASRLYHIKPDYIYCERTEVCFIIGYFKKEAFRIICTGVIPEERRKGWGRLLVSRAEAAAKGKVKRMETRSLSGADFYTALGYDIVSMRGGGTSSCKNHLINELLPITSMVC